MSIAFPADGEIVTGTISVSVSASDDIGVTAVELYLDGDLLATDNTAPYSFTWDTGGTADGMHTLQVMAYDAAGNVATSAEVTVTVENSLPDLTAPSATIISPQDGSTVSKVVKIRVQASDDSQLNQVQLFFDGNLLRTVGCDGNSCTFQVAWNTKRAPRDLTSSLL